MIEKCAWAIKKEIKEKLNLVENRKLKNGKAQVKGGMGLNIFNGRLKRNFAQGRVQHVENEV